HSFRHSCAVNRLYNGESLTDIRNRLGHENLETTMIYLKLDISHKRESQKKLLSHFQTKIGLDPKIEELFTEENKQKTLAWLDSL
ncbi:MAG: tyrosine-type recombinase/integrase, partial [bacterium]